MTDITAKLAEALALVREYAEFASRQTFDGTNGPAIREEAKRRLALIDTGLAAYRQHTEAQAGGTEGATSVGDTRFESWLSDDYTATNIYDKHDMRAAYWAGYTERAALAAAPAAPAESGQASVVLTQAEQAALKRALLASVKVIDPAPDDRALTVLQRLVDIIDAAGLLNLSAGVQLGPHAWLDKASKAMNDARAALAAQGMDQANALWEMAKAERMRLAGYFLNTATPGHEPRFERVADDHIADRDVIPLWATVEGFAKACSGASFEMAKAEQAVPVAWLRGVVSPDTPMGAAEYDEECCPGEDRPNGDGWVPLYTTPPAVERRPLTEADTEDLERLEGLFNDDEGWDLPKERMQRLAELGAIRRTSGNHYAITAFGMSCLHPEQWGMPLKTAAEWNEVMRLKSLGITAGTTEQAKEQM